LWKTEKGDVHLEFFGCGEKICGKIVWLYEPKYVNEIDEPVGIAKFDRKNPDPTLMNRLILGLQVMKGVTYLGKNKWGGGVCYDPQSGNMITAPELFNDNIIYDCESAPGFN
jgi:uncharacterized protein (DUF2147 family)